MLDRTGKWHPILATLEFADVVNSLFKHILPQYLLRDPVFWFGAAYINPLVAIKLGGRYARNGCIRNHTNHTHTSHNCKRKTGILQIYFGAPVTGGQAENSRKLVTYLSRYGNVLTNNLAHANPDEPDKTPEQIHYLDMRRLVQADILIADVSNPTTGTGFMLGHAARLGIPILCLAASDKPVSAMIAGSKSITTRKYTSYAEAAKHIREFITFNFPHYPTVNFPKMGVLIVGPPGAGKTTLGQDLASRFPMPSISTGQLLRDSPTPEITELMNKGALIPARQMMQILNKRLNEGDAALFGYVVDGYPSSLENLEAFKDIRGSPDVVVYMEASQEVCEQRIVGRASRASDTSEVAKKRRGIFDLNADSFCKAFPDAHFLYLDTSSSTDPTQITDKVSTFLEGRVGFTSRFHVHIDGPNIAYLMNFKNKIEYEYPFLANRFNLEQVTDLCLGPQVKQMPESYNDMPNFHTIINCTYEGFLTLNMGEKFDRKAMEAILTHVRESGKEYNVELEEYINKSQITLDGENVLRRVYKVTPKMDAELRALSAFDRNRAKKIPKLELHLGFDLPKQGITKLNLDMFVRKLSDAGLNNGGWFQFDDPRY
jgi:adenylate kinase family enzyme/nucleoside 2-deoxyribosyltransferase